MVFNPKVYFGDLPTSLSGLYAPGAKQLKQQQNVSDCQKNRKLQNVCGQGLIRICITWEEEHKILVPVRIRMARILIAKIILQSYELTHTKVKCFHSW